MADTSESLLAIQGWIARLNAGDLAALNIRRELLDLCKRYCGLQGMGAHHATMGPDAQGTPDTPGRDSLDPGSLGVWSEFHEQVERLADEEWTVFDLLW